MVRLCAVFWEVQAIKETCQLGFKWREIKEGRWSCERKKEREEGGGLLRVHLSHSSLLGCRELHKPTAIGYCHVTESIEDPIGEIKSFPNWTPRHQISNRGYVLSACELPLHITAGPARTTRKVWMAPSTTEALVFDNRVRKEATPFHAKFQNSPPIHTNWMQVFSTQNV